MDNFFKFSNDDFILDTDDNNIKSKNKLSPSYALTSEEVLSGWGEDTVNTNTAKAGGSPLEALKARMRSAQQENEVTHTDEGPAQKPIAREEKKTQTEPQERSLLKKLKRYTVDDEGHDLSENNAPLYELESVAEIIKNDGERALKALSKKYDVSVDDLGKSKQEMPPQPAKEKPVEKPKAVPTESKANPSPTPAFEKMVSDSEARMEKQLFDELFPDSAENEVIPDISIPNISDTDNMEIGVPGAKSDISNTATIRFTPVRLDGDQSSIRVSSTTRVIDISQEITEAVAEITDPKETVLEQTEFELYEPKDEVCDLTSAKRIMRALAYKKRASFLRTLVSGVLTFILVLFALPPLSDILISNPRLAMIITGSIYAATALANIDMFIDFVRLFKKQCSHDIMVSLATLTTVALAVSAAAVENNAYYIILLGGIILFVRALCQFLTNSATLGNLKQIANPKTKMAVSLISDSSTTFAMAKNSIQGDVLISAPRKTDFVSDFMKYSGYGSKLSGKVTAIFFVTFALATISAVAAAFYYGSAYHAIYGAAAIAITAAMPTLIFIDALPIFSASRLLNRKGAMIAGKSGAMQLELSNAAVISSQDIFPEGSITLQNMKVLSDNNIDETILCAAALTTEMGSTLAPIFQKIAGTNDSYKMPATSMVKYEERLGISGWVNNKMLFIGNRTIMEGHGIEVPSIEVDRRILRNGYFPVYVAADGKACALLIIQYSVRPEIIKELHRVTRLGVTLLVDNCDPNISEAMICDYFDLYEDSVKVMTNAGVHMYKNATVPVEKCSAPAAFRRSSITFISILNCASRIKQANLWLTVLYTVCAVFGVLYFVYSSFSSGGNMLNPINVLLYELIATALSIIAFLCKKP